MASTFGTLGQRSRLTPISANGGYQFLCILPSKVLFQAIVPAPSHSTTCAYTGLGPLIFKAHGKGVISFQRFLGRAGWTNSIKRKVFEVGLF